MIFFNFVCVTEQETDEDSFRQSPMIVGVARQQFYGSLLRKRLADRAAWDYSGSTASATGLLIVYGEPGARLKLVGVTVNTKSLLALALSA